MVVRRRAVLASALLVMLCQHALADDDDDDDDAAGGGGELDDDVKRKAIGIRDPAATREEAPSARTSRFHDGFVAAQHKLYGREDQVPASLINHFKFDRSWEIAKGGFCTGGPCGEHCKKRLRRECWDTARHPEGASEQLIGADKSSKEPQAYNCIECAIKKQLASDAKDRQDLSCPTAYLQQQCQHWDVARQWQQQRTKEGITIARKEFVPKGGFRSVYGEMGACVLDKAELLVDMVYQMATCKSYDNYRGSECFDGTSQDFVTHLRMCCAGNTKDGGTESAADCKKLLLPVISKASSSIAPLFEKCARDSSHCAPLHSALLDCYEMFDEWKARSTQSGSAAFSMGLQAWDSTAKAESPLDQFYFSEQESEEHTIEKERKAGGQRRPLERRVCMQLLGSDDALVLPVFRDMLRAAYTLFSVARRVLRHKSPNQGDVSNHDLTPQGALLLNVCSNPQGERRHINEEKAFTNHGQALKCIDEGSGQVVELKEGDHIVEHGQGVQADPNLNWHVSYPTYKVTKPKSLLYPMMLKRVMNWDDCEHSWHCMHPMKVDKACVDKLLKPRCNKGSCVVPGHRPKSGEWLCQQLTALPEEVDASAIASAGGMKRMLRRRLRKQRAASYLDAHTADHMLPPLLPDGGAAPAKTTSPPEPAVPFTPPLPPDWFASFSEKKQKGTASEKLHKKVYATVPGKPKKPERVSAVYLASDGLHCSHDFRVSEEVSDEECAMRVSAMLEPADADAVLSDPNET